MSTRLKGEAEGTVTGPPTGLSTHIPYLDGLAFPMLASR